MNRQANPSTVGVSVTHRALRVILWIVSIVEALASLVLVFASNWIVGYLPVPLSPIGVGILLTLLKSIGIVGLALAYLFWHAGRDPERYLAVVDALAFILVAAAGLEMYALAFLHVGLFYPPLYLVVRAVVQLVLAAVIVALRPKRAAAAAR